MKKLTISLTTYKTQLLLFLIILLSGCVENGRNWERLFLDYLPVLGHRNWVAVVDSAYPSQNQTGMQTLVTGGDHLQVIGRVMDAINKVPHVRADIFIDSELAELEDGDVPGISEFRNNLSATLAGKKISQKLHENIIRQLDEAAGKFSVLVLKTNGVMPYTSVFFQLQCGYWSEKMEQKLREKIALPGR